MEWVITNKWIFIGIITITALFALIHYIIRFIRRKKEEQRELEEWRKQREKRRKERKIMHKSTTTEGIIGITKAIIIDKMAIEESEATLEASFTNDLGADSLDTVELIMEFEHEFGITIPDDAAEKISTIGDAANYISLKVQEYQKEMDIFPREIKEEMLLYLTLDGKIKVIPVFKDEMGNLIQIDNTNNEKGELTKEKELEIYFVNKKKQKYEEKAEELEYLLSQEHIKENELQKFFERNPEFILDGEYCEAIPQVILKDENDKKNIPDFILKPNENISVPAKIVELKLPNVKAIHNYTRAEAFTQKISIAIGQLRKYYRYFNSDENRKKFLEKYHFQVFCPRLALIVGKDIVDIDKETLDDLKTTFNGIDITTYNEVLANYRQKIKHLFK